MNRNVRLFTLAIRSLRTDVYTSSEQGLGSPATSRLCLPFGCWKRKQALVLFRAFVSTENSRHQQQLKRCRKADGWGWTNTLNPACDSINHSHALDICTANKHNSRRSPFQLIHILWGCQPPCLPPLIYSPSTQAESQRAREIKELALSLLKDKGGGAKHTEYSCDLFCLSHLTNYSFLPVAPSVWNKTMYTSNVLAEEWREVAEWVSTPLLSVAPENVTGKSVFPDACL